jgi:uncharacterized protein (TIGR02145 family)
MKKLIDIDGNEYQTVQIGNQIWMAENLRVKYFKGGTPIMHAPSDEDWLRTSGKFDKKSLPAWCSYNNELENENKYGLLYSYSVISHECDIATEGWRMPEAKDFEDMFNYLEGEPEPYGFSLLSGKLKAKNEWWDNPFHNESGFSALPSGNRLTKLRPTLTELNREQYQRALVESKTFHPIIAFEGLGKNCTFWASGTRLLGYSMFIFLKNEKNEEIDFVLVGYTENSHSGRSIRLIKKNQVIEN